MEVWAIASYTRPYAYAYFCYYYIASYIAILYNQKISRATILKIGKFLLCNAVKVNKNPERYVCQWQLVKELRIDSVIQTVQFCSCWRPNNIIEVIQC